MIQQSVIAPPTWSSANGTATHPLASGVVRLDVAAPARGIEVRSDADSDRVLGVDLAALADHWIRGRDVVAIYEPDDARRLRSTVMWRTIPGAGGGAAWEVVVSAQTSRLETPVDVTVHSDVAADTVVWSPAGAEPCWRPLAAAPQGFHAAAVILARRGGSSCLVAVHPGDARSTEISTAPGRCGIATRLFAADLEKGVLLRSRVLAAVGPRADDEAWATRLLRDFAASPPPLDT